MKIFLSLIGKVVGQIIGTTMKAALKCTLMVNGMIRIVTKKLGLYVKQNLFFVPKYIFNLQTAQCLKITEKVSFNIASEASYVYILSGQKLVENAKIEKLKCDILGDF